MKFTVVLLAALSVTWASNTKKSDDPKEKREAPVGYPSASHGYQTSSLGQNDASAISVGAGYSVGGGKQGYSYSPSHGGAQLQLSSESLQPSGHATLQLPALTLQGGQGIVTSDLSQLMSQLQHGLNSGALTLGQGGELYQQQAGHGGGQELYQQAALGGGQELYQQGAYGNGQVLSQPQYSFAPQKFQYAVSEQPSVPSYAVGTKGLGSYSTGPVLFTPDAHGNAPQQSYGAPSAGLSLGGSSGSGHGHGHGFLSAPSAGYSFGGLSGGGHSFGEGLTLGGGSGHSLSGLSFGGAGHSFGAPSKGYGAPAKTSFKPSAFLGTTVQGESGHGFAGLSGSYGAPSFAGFGGGNHGGLSFSSGDHSAFGGSIGGFGGGSSKFTGNSYLPPKSSGFGSSLESVASFSSDGHFASPPGTTYGVPTTSYGVPSSAAHAASSASPQYYAPSKSSYPSYSGSSSSYRAPTSAGYSTLGHSSSGPKYGFNGHQSPSSRSGSPKDVQGAHSETSYNTIKYSEEVKPRAH